MFFLVNDHCSGSTSDVGHRKQLLSLLPKWHTQGSSLPSSLFLVGLWSYSHQRWKFTMLKLKHAYIFLNKLLQFMSSDIKIMFITTICHPSLIIAYPLKGYGVNMLTTDCSTTRMVYCSSWGMEPITASPMDILKGVHVKFSNWIGFLSIP